MGSRYFPGKKGVRKARHLGCGALSSHPAAGGRLPLPDEGCVARSQLQKSPMKIHGQKKDNESARCRESHYRTPTPERVSPLSSISSHEYTAAMVRAKYGSGASWPGFHLLP